MEIIFLVADHGPLADNLKSGDVLHIAPDGWPWTIEELANPNWRIVRADILGTHERMLMMSYIQTHLRMSGKKYPHRKYRIDRSALPNPEKYTGSRIEAITDLQSGHIAAATKSVP